VLPFSPVYEGLSSNTILLLGCCYSHSYSSSSVAPFLSTPLPYVNVTSSSPSSAFALFSFTLASSSLPPQAVRTVINTSIKKLLIHFELDFIFLPPCFVIDFSNRLHFCI